MGLVQAHYLLHRNAELGHVVPKRALGLLSKEKTGAFVHRVVRKDAGGVLSEKETEQLTHF